MLVVVHVAADTARCLHANATPSDEGTLAKVRQLTEIADELGVMLVPTHPGIDDPTLVTHFRVNVPDRATADRVVAVMLQADAVEAAYFKPPDEPAPM